MNTIYHFAAQISKIDRRYIYLAWTVAIIAMLAVGAGAPSDFGDRAVLTALR